MFSAARLVKAIYVLSLSVAMFVLQPNVSNGQFGGAMPGLQQGVQPPFPQMNGMMGGGMMMGMGGGGMGMGGGMTGMGNLSPLQMQLMSEFGAMPINSMIGSSQMGMGSGMMMGGMGSGSGQMGGSMMMGGMGGRGGQRGGSMMMGGMGGMGGGGMGMGGGISGTGNLNPFQMQLMSEFGAMPVNGNGMGGFAGKGMGGFNGRKGI